MCRLLGVACPQPETIADVLGSEMPSVFQDMARLHNDGWGHAWLNDAGEVRSERFAESGLQHPRLATALQALRSRAQLIHIRFATHGFARSLANTHPFVADGMAFAHNGSLLPASDLDSLIRPGLALSGSTDSERYFAVIRRELQAGRPLPEAVLHAVRSIRKVYPRASLNALLLAPQRLVAVHASQHTPLPLHELQRRSASSALPAGHDDRYFRMHIRRTTDGSIAVASSGLDVGNWDDLPDESVTTIRLDTLESESLPLG